MVTTTGAWSDDEYMARALALAGRGTGLTAPNPMVGAVLVDETGVILGQGYHERAGGPHAEIVALKRAGSRARGATLYCTLEPCSHHGRTGPCAEAVVEAGVARVVAAVEDPNPTVAGRGFRFLRDRGVRLEVGIGRAAAVRLNAPFFTRMQRGRPFVTMKIATSVDGRIASGPGRRTRLTSRLAERHAHSVRAAVDGIAVGSGTILTDDPLLTAREVFRERPLLRIILDRRLRTPSTARILGTRAAGPVWIFTTEEARASRYRQAEELTAAGAAIEVTDGTLAAVLERLAALDVSWLLVEGGSVVHEAAWRAGLVDHVQCYVGPGRLGSEGVPWMPGVAMSLASLHGRRTTLLGPDVLVEGDVYRPD